MILYILYRIGYSIALNFPLKVSYAIAAVIADACHLILVKDRRSVVKNLRVIAGGTLSERQIRRKARMVFRNFAKYLVDFFRLSFVNDDYIKKFVRIDGEENMERARRESKRGVILLSAHVGNWELGGFVLSLTGYPLSAIVLTHKNKLINDFFTRQRMLGNFKPIEIGISLRSCYRTLKDNNMLAVLGDRDFSKNGLYLDFFGKKTLIPKGAAVFSYRVGSIIVPTFMIRERDNTFRIKFCQPIFPDSTMGEEQAVTELAKAYTAAIEACVREYPDQWYMFREVWEGDEKSMRADTGI